MYGYNAPYQQYQQLTRVNGLEGAKAYQVMPGCTMALFDANEDLFYVKTADSAGFPSVRTFRFEEIQPQAPENKDFVSRKEMEEYVKQLIQNTTANTETKSSANGRSNKGESRSTLQSTLSEQSEI